MCWPCISRSNERHDVVIPYHDFRRSSRQGCRYRLLEFVFSLTFWALYKLIVLLLQQQRHM